MSGPEDWGAKRATPAERPTEGPAAWGATQTGAADKEEPTNWGSWLRTRVQKGLEGVLTGGRSAADINVAVSNWVLAKQLDMPKVAEAAEWTIRHLIPGGTNMSMDELHSTVNKITGFSDTNAPKSWGVAGRALDAGTEAVAGSFVAPGSTIARTVVPAFASGAAAELAGDAAKGTPLELPARIVGGVAGGVGGGFVQNVAGNTAKGAANLIGANARDAERQAARVIGRNLIEDRDTAAALVARHGDYLAGTPLVAAGGENLQGSVRGAMTLKGPARNIIRDAADAFIEGADQRVAPVLNMMSPLPPAEVRVPQLINQAQTQARPQYLASGVADTPQQVLQRQPGAPIVSQVPLIGPMPFATVSRPGPTTTAVVGTNSPILQSPALHDFIGQSRIVQAAVNRVRDTSAFAREPTTSMTMLDKVYKDLGSMETTAYEAKDFGRYHQINAEKQQLARHIEAENPTYGRALLAYSEPAKLADAAKLGERLARANLDPVEVRRQFDGLATQAEQQEFLGGFTGVLRGKAGATDRATPAERFWNSSYTRGKVEQLFGLPAGSYGPGDYEHINRLLQGERQAARDLRNITKGSTTANKAIEASDLAGGDAAGVVSDVLHKGVRGALVAKALEAGGAIKQRVAEGRTQAVNAAMARMMMNPDPAAAVRTQGLVATAQQQAAATDAARRGVYQSGPTAGLLQQMGPADRLMQGLLMNP